MVSSLLGLLPPPQNVIEDTCWPFPGFRGSGNGGAPRFGWGGGGALGACPSRCPSGTLTR